MFVLAPLYGSMEGFGTAVAICMLLPAGLVVVMLILCWAVFGMWAKERHGSPLTRIPRLPPLAPASGERSLPEWTDAIHLHAVAWLHMEKLAGASPAVRQELQRVISGIVQTEMTGVATQSQRQAVTKVVVGRLLSEIGEHGTQGDRNEPV